MASLNLKISMATPHALSMTIKTQNVLTVSLSRDDHLDQTVTLKTRNALTLVLKGGG